MGGGAIQLEAYGVEDETLTKDPQVTFFKTVFKRHSAFALESIPQKLKGKIEFGRQATCIISPVGDMISKCYLEVDLDAPLIADTSWVPWLGHVLIDYVEFYVGDQLIDKQTGQWMHIWSELTVPFAKKTAYNSMISSTETADSIKMIIPLHFWFCRDFCSAFPICALQSQQVKMKFKFNTLSKCLNIHTALSQSFSAKLYVDYVFLDDDERSKIENTSSDHVISQLQYTKEPLDSAENGEQEISLNFLHPVTEMIWALKTTGMAINQFTTCAEAQISFNGHPRTSKMNGRFFSLLQPYYFHSNVLAGSSTYDILSGRVVKTFNYSDGSQKTLPDGTFDNTIIIKSSDSVVVGTGIVISHTITDTFADIMVKKISGDWSGSGDVSINGESTVIITSFTKTGEEMYPNRINMYSFSLDPEGVQPTGSCNMSEIENAILTVSSSDSASELLLYALNYNVLTIANGTCELLFGN